MRRIRTVTDVGHSVISFVSAMGAGTITFYEALMGFSLANQRQRRRIFQQMALVGIESLPIVLITVLFGGMVIGLQTAKQFILYGAGQYVGGVVSVSMAREIAPTLTGIVVAARIGASFAAELGTMKITNQIDALRSLATNPGHYLITPRLIASAIMLPILTVYSMITGIVGGGLVAINAGVSYSSFVNSATTFLEGYDIEGGLIKTFVFGIIIAITSCYIGLRTEGGAAGVGKSTTSAVVWSIILLYASNLLMSWLLYSYRS